MQNIDVIQQTNLSALVHLLTFQEIKLFLLQIFYRNL